MAGLPFWDESDESFFDDSDEYLQNASPNDPMYADQADGIESPYRNKLAERVVERIAAEKKAKMQLITDLEPIKEKFAEWEACLEKQELHDVASAAQFLNSQVEQAYYNLLLIFMNVSDSNATDGTATKEIIEVKDVLRHLSQRSDEKVTYTNGFHVNQAVTGLEKVYIDENQFSPDYDNFFKCA